MKHNELMNIWTHLIGGCIFIAIMVYVAIYFGGASFYHVKEALLHKVDQSTLVHAIKTQIDQAAESLSVTR